MRRGLTEQEIQKVLEVDSQSQGDSEQGEQFYLVLAPGSGTGNQELEVGLLEDEENQTSDEDSVRVHESNSVSEYKPESDHESDSNFPSNDGSVLGSILEVDLTREENESSRFFSQKRKSTSGSKGQPKKGRLEDQIWNLFDCIEADPKTRKKILVACKCCQQQYRWPKVERLRSHRCKQSAMSSTSIAVGGSGVRPSVGSCQTQTISIAGMNQRYNSSKDKIDIQVGRFIFGSNLPFSTVDQPEFRKLLRLLKPTYIPPVRQTLATTILAKVYSEVMNESSEQLFGKLVTIMQDGWTATQSSPVISHSLSIECTGTYFLNAIPTQADKKTTPYCLKLLEDAVQDAENVHKCKVIGVVTDNTNGMVLMRNIMNEKHPGIYAYGCNTHLINLVAKAVSKGKVVDDVKRIQHFFKDHTFSRETLKKVGALQPILPNETRWNSQYACLKNFMKNHSAYMQIAKDATAKVPAEIVALLGFGFYQEVQSVVMSLKPLAKALKWLQCETASIADAVTFWLQIMKDVRIPTDYSAKFIEKTEMGLTPFACAAYLLHPKYRGAGLPESYAKRGLDWVSEKSPSFEIAQYKLSQNDETYYFSRLMPKDKIQGTRQNKRDIEIFKAQISPVQWWKEMEVRKGNMLPHGLVELAAKLMILPASTSGMERCFSTLGNIMTERDRLGLEKASQLCAIYRSLYDKNRIKESSTQ